MYIYMKREIESEGERERKKKERDVLLTSATPIPGEVFGTYAVIVAR